MDTKLKSDKYLDFERLKWDDYYKAALAGVGQEHDKSLWWHIMDTDSAEIVMKYLSKKKELKIIEPGCGSGIASFKLSEYLDSCQLTLCDISENALRFAKTIEPAHLKGAVSYQVAEISQMPFKNEMFDLTWNIGVIEHYPLERICQMVNEMLRVTAEGGYVMVAIPNCNSIAARKAWLLGSQWGRKYLKYIPGYRFDSEILYKNDDLRTAIARGTGKDVTIEYAGNLLWVGAPQFLVKLTNAWFPKSRFSFLSFFILRK